MIKAIYLPGIGDHRPWFQDKLISLWQLFGVKAVFQPIGWASSEPFDKKLEIILGRIDELTENGEKIALIGVSAGASAALSAYMARPDSISAVVFVCGKVHGVDNVNKRYFHENPAFQEAMNISDNLYKQLTQEDKAKMLYVYCKHDKTVIPRLNRLEGVKDKKVFGFSHVSGIYLAITIHMAGICRFIKNQS